MGVTQHRLDDDQHILDYLSDALREAALADTIAEYGPGAYDPRRRAFGLTSRAR
jgi:hypothetical protein